MLATLEKTDIQSTSSDTLENDLFPGAYELEIPDQVQSSLETILDFYKNSGMKPAIKVQGTPLDVTVALVKTVKQSLPQSLQIDAKNLLDFMVREIASYARDAQARSLSLNFSFEKG